MHHNSNKERNISRKTNFEVLICLTMPFVFEKLTFQWTTNCDVNVSMYSSAYLRLKNYLDIVVIISKWQINSFFISSPLTYVNVSTETACEICPKNSSQNRNPWKPNCWIKLNKVITLLWVFINLTRSVWLKFPQVNQP